MTIRVSQDVAAPPEAVWADLSDIASHAEWMADAETIRFTGSRRSGVGASFECATRVGPLRLTDRMEVTEWVPESVIGVSHRGLVSGEGRFRLTPLPGPGGSAHTQFTWTERLRFRWFLGGPLAAALAKPVLRRIWQRNLRAFSSRF